MLFSLFGCIPPLEGPVVLAAGIGEPVSISLTAQEQLMVGSSNGVYWVDKSGVVVQDAELKGVPIRSVASHNHRYYALGNEKLFWKETSKTAWNVKELKGNERSIRAWKNESLLLVGVNQIYSMDSELDNRTLFSDGWSDISDVSYDTQDGCGGLIVASSTGVYRLCKDERTKISSLQVSQITTVRNSIWGLQEGQFGVLRSGRLSEVRDLDARDVLFGGGPFFPDHMLYLVTSDTLELLQCLPER
jgi:hypothetical protein